MISKTYKENPIITKFKSLPQEEKNFILEGFNRSIVESGKCSSVHGVEDDYQSNAHEYYIYRNQFRQWLSGYFYFRENSIEHLLERSKEVLAEENKDCSHVPTGVTVDRFGFCYCLRDIDGIVVRTFSLNELKNHWVSGLKLVKK